MFSQSYCNWLNNEAPRTYDGEVYHPDCLPERTEDSEEEVGLDQNNAFGHHTCGGCMETLGDLDEYCGLGPEECSVCALIAYGEEGEDKDDEGED